MDILLTGNSEHVIRVVCPPLLSSLPDGLPEVEENWTFDTCSGLYAKEEASYRFSCWAVPFLIKRCNQTYFTNTHFCILGALAMGRACERDCLTRLAVAMCVLRTTEGSDRAGRCHRRLLLFPSANIRLLGIRSCRHGQPVSLRQLPGSRLVHSNDE